jgi:hypothetical protein
MERLSSHRFFIFIFLTWNQQKTKDGSAGDVGACVGDLFGYRSHGPTY